MVRQHARASRTERLRRSRVLREPRVHPPLYAVPRVVPRVVEAVPPPTEVGLGEVGMGEVPVVDLFIILVENHRMEVREAVQDITLGMLSAGYPADCDTVSATDAMDILEDILAGHG
jgi:hypothetical protein